MLPLGHCDTAMITNAETHGQMVWFPFLGRLFDSRPNKAGLNCPSVRPCIRTYVRPSTKSFFFDFNQTWRVSRGRRVMHDSMQYVPIQDLVQGHNPFKVGNLAVFKSYLYRYL